MPTVGQRTSELPFVRLRELPLAERCAAALKLVRNSDGEARQTTLRVAAELVPESDLLALLREEGDDVARNAGLEMLKLRGRRVLPRAMELLSDPDDDVVMQATQLVDAIGDPRGWDSLRPLLNHPNINIVQAVIAAAPRVGGRSAALDLLPFLQKDPWLQIAAIDAIGRLHARAAVPALRRLLNDPLACEFAADALARIGGMLAARSLAGYFLMHEQELDPGRWLGLLATVFADLERPYCDGDLRERIARYLETAHRQAASACLLAQGPGDEDVVALAGLAETSPSTSLPLCLRRRADLLPLLLMAQPPALQWGLELAADVPDAIPGDVVARALLTCQPQDRELVGRLVAHVTNEQALIELFAGLSLEVRTALHPALRAAAARIAPCIESESLDSVDEILLREIAGAEPETLRSSVIALDEESRLRVLPQLQTAAVHDALPWTEWVVAQPAIYLPLFAEAAGRFRSPHLRSLFRDLLRREPSPALLKSAGAVGDPATVPLLVAAYASATPLGRAFALEAVGEIGGATAREFLRGIAFGAEGSEIRQAARAFARCADLADTAELTALTRHGDWAIRLCALEALGRLDRLESGLLETLLADPSPVVAEKAWALIDVAARRDR